MNVFRKYCISMPGLQGLGGGVVFVTKFYFTEVKISPGTHQNTWKYNVCSLKRETKMMSLHKIEVENVSSFLLNKYAIHDF